jgi:hypothetical protein
MHLLEQHNPFPELPELSGASSSTADIAQYADLFSARISDVQKKHFTELTDAEAALIDDTVRDGTAIVTRLIGKHELALPDFVGREDAMMLNQLVSTANTILRDVSTATPIADYSFTKLTEPTGWVLFGSVMEHYLKSLQFDLPNREPMEVFSKNILKMLTKLAEKNDGIPLDDDLHERFARLSQRYQSA